MGANNPLEKYFPDQKWESTPPQTLPYPLSEAGGTEGGRLLGNEAPAHNPQQVSILTAYTESNDRALAFALVIVGGARVIARGFLGHVTQHQRVIGHGQVTPRVRDQWNALSVTEKTV